MMAQERYGLSIPATVGVKADFAAVFDNTNKILKGYKDGSFISEDLVGSSDVQSDNEPLVTIGVPNNSLTLLVMMVNYTLYLFGMKFIQIIRYKRYQILYNLCQ